ncbi:hypothetical protein [Streptomyces albogriseolus]|uniref:hypothetical protein n=1 Tax=Streptomyces albogriseolus TaxID=1887 RepID=UPI0034613F42
MDLTAEGASIPLVHIGFGEVTGPPEPEAGPRHVVSRLVAGALPDRSDLLVPHDVVRDEAGRTTGCRALAVGASRRTAGEA